MIRVLQLSGSFSKKDGRMSVLMNVYRSINRNKIQFDFLATNMNDENYISEIKQLGGRVYEVPAEYGNNFIYIKNKVHTIVKQEKYIIVHYHATSQYVLSLVGLRQLGVEQIIVHSHSSTYSDTFLKSIRNRILSIPMFFVNAKRVAVSEEAGKGLFYALDCNVIPNSIEVDRFAFSKEARKQIRSEFNLEEDTFIIGNVGRYTIQKNQLFILDVFKKFLVDVNSNAQLFLIGNGPMEKQIKAKISILEIEEKVNLIDTKSDIERYYSAMDVFLFPSTYEGFGMVVIEAQANGLPVVMSNFVPELVQLDGVIVKNLNDNVSKWVEALVTSRNQNKLRENGIVFVTKAGFDSKDVAKKWELMYQNSEDN